jgi:FkbM family methyltransferase
MNYTLRHFAATECAHIPNRKLRERAAEQRLIRLFFEDRTSGFFVEVGANEPKLTSMTWHLEAVGWTGILVEPIPELCADLRRERPQSQVFQAACAAPEGCGMADFVVTPDRSQSTLKRDALADPSRVARIEQVQVRTLDSILAEAGNPRPDFVSIDVEGAQLDVLRGFALETVRPRLLLIEDHLTDFQTHRYLTRRGYRLCKRTGLNNWYIPRGTAFRLTSLRERAALLGKFLRTPTRGLEFALKRRRRRAAEQSGAPSAPQPRPSRDEPPR